MVRRRWPLFVVERVQLRIRKWRMSYPNGALLKLTNDLNNYLSFSINGDASKMIAVQSQLASHLGISEHQRKQSTNVADGRGRVAWTADGRIIFNSSSVMGSSIFGLQNLMARSQTVKLQHGFNDWPAISR